MLKLILIVSLASSTAFLAAGRVHYSGLQLQTPFGSAFKVTPDPSNIWSFHETVQFSTTGTKSVPVLVDFDKNGKMDTEHKDARVLITDIAIDAPDLLNNLQLKDAKGVRWRVMRVPTVYSYRERFTTPLALPVDSNLNVEFEVTTATVNMDIHIHLIGRLVTL